MLIEGRRGVRLASALTVLAAVAHPQSAKSQAHRSQRIATMPDSTFWPEGVDYDPRSGSFYLASVRHGTIAELRADGTVRELWARHRPDVGAVMGVRIDPKRGVLWATMSGMPQREGFVAADTVLAALLEIRPADGTIIGRWNVSPSAGGHVLGDLAVSPGGDVFMTDSRAPVLYRLRATRDTLESIRSPLFASLQGVAPAADGRTLYVADYRNGLLALDLTDGAVTRLADAAGVSSRGIDGIVVDGTGAIVGVQNGVSPARIMRFVVNAERTSIERAELLDVGSAEIDEPTIGTMARGRFVYVANSQWEKYDASGARRRKIPLAAPILMGIDLEP